MFLLGVGGCDLLFGSLFLAELDPAGRHVELFVSGKAAHAQSIFQNLDDLCVDEVLADLDANDAADFDFADVAHGLPPVVVLSELIRADDIT